VLQKKAEDIASSRLLDSCRANAACAAGPHIQRALTICSTIRASRGVSHPTAGRRPIHVRRRDALVLKVRENGRVVGVHTLIATGVNAEGYREILGVAVSSAEDGAGWLAFLRDLVARGLSGVALVTSDAHPG
jgi:hypothetical protein